MNNENRNNQLKKFIFLVTITTVFLVVSRIIYRIFEFPEFLESLRDVDYYMRFEEVKNGLFDFYNPDKDFPAVYLYYWYFIFFPMSLIPTEIGLYIWDGLRLISTIYVMKKVPKITDNPKDLFVFYGGTLVGYLLDGYFNNCNFLIQLLLLESYLSWEKGRKWVAGLLFTLALFKINVFIYLPILGFIKKIKLKDLIYYLLPIGLLSIFYIIFPDFFLQMLKNWVNLEGQEPVAFTPFSFIIIFNLLTWQALQPAQLMYFCLMVIIATEYFQDIKKRERFRKFVVISLTSYYIIEIILVILFPPV